MVMRTLKVRGVGDVPVHAGLLVEGVYLGALGDLVDHEGGFSGLVEVVELFHRSPDLVGWLAAVAVVEKRTSLPIPLTVPHVVGVPGELFGVLDEDLEARMIVRDAGRSVRSRTPRTPQSEREREAWDALLASLKNLSNTLL
jgi:hypothetical protein